VTQSADFQEALQMALGEEINFEAVGLVEMSSTPAFAFQTIQDVPHGLRIGLERFLNRIAHDTESSEQLTQANNAVFYDIDQRQLVCNLVETKTRRYIFVVVVPHQKSYKQSTKRIVKKLQQMLD
jgi:hypothetical protein